MNGNGGQGYKNFMLLDHMRSYGGPNGDGDLGPVLVSDDLFPVIAHQTAQHFLLSPWCTEGPRYGDIDQNDKPVLVTEDEENFIVEWEDAADLATVHVHRAGRAISGHVPRAV